MRLEVDVLPRLRLHQVFAGDVGDVLLDLRRVAMPAAERVGTEVVLRLGEQLVRRGAASRARVAALGVDDDRVLHDVPRLQHRHQPQRGRGRVAARVRDAALALGKVAHDLGDAVHGVMGHFGVRVLRAVPLLPHRHVAEADVRADVDDLLARGKHDLRPLRHLAGGDLDEHHVAVLGSLADVLLRQIHDLLIVEPAQRRMVQRDRVAHAVGVEHVDELALRVRDHHAQHFAANIADRADCRISYHVFVPPSRIFACCFVHLHNASHFITWHIVRFAHKNRK